MWSLVLRWGESDDEDRGGLTEAASDEELSTLVEAVDPLFAAINSYLVPQQATYEGRVHHFDLRVAQNWLPAKEEVRCAKEYAFERSPTRRAIACCGSCGDPLALW